MILNSTRRVLDPVREPLQEYSHWTPFNLHSTSGPLLPVLMLHSPLAPVKLGMWRCIGDIPRCDCMERGGQTCRPKTPLLPDDIRRPFRTFLCETVQ